MRAKECPPALSQESRLGRGAIENPLACPRTKLEGTGGGKNACFSAKKDKKNETPQKLL